jgi:hypothetical protein
LGTGLNNPRHIINNKGLKLKEAAALAIVVLIPSIYVFMSPLIRGLELTNLFFYMDVWPTALAVFGYAIAYLASKRFNFHRFIPLYLGLGASVLTITYWHLPANSLFGYGVCPADLNNPLLYQAKRLSYVVVGFLLYGVAVKISKPWREALAIALGKVMGWYGLYLTLIETPIYVAPPVIFSTTLHHEAGFAMIVSMLFLDFLAVFSLVSHVFKGHPASPYPLLTEQN